MVHDSNRQIHSLIATYSDDTALVWYHNAPHLDWHRVSSEHGINPEPFGRVDLGEPITSLEFADIARSLDVSGYPV